MTPQYHLELSEYVKMEVSTICHDRDGIIEYNNTCQNTLHLMVPSLTYTGCGMKCHSKISCNIFPTLKSPWCMSLKKSLQSCKCTRLIYTGYQNSKVRQSSLKKNLFASV